LKHTPAHRFNSPDAPTVLIGHKPDDFRDLWPRSSARGDVRAFVFQCADILDVWCNTIGRARGVEPLFVTVLATSGRPALLLPFGIQTQHGTRILRFLDGGVSDYNAPIVLPDAAAIGDAQTIWSEISRYLPPFDVAILEKMPQMVGDLANPLFPLAQNFHHESCHAVALYGPWETFAHDKISNAADSRRRRRKLDKLGTVQIGIAESAEMREQFLAAMMRMKRRKYIDTKGYDAFQDPGAEDYFLETTRRLGAGGPVQLSALTLDGRILAAHWGYVTGDRFYHLMPAHEGGEWRAYAPGRLLNEWLLQWCIERGLKYLDFGIGDEPYKFDYCDLHIPLRDAFLPVTLKGRLYATARKLETAAKTSIRDTRLGVALIAARKRWRNPSGSPQIE
jgi:CelD/BcsL family acetyltransferase involved in cellulose biosynthesis